MATGLNLKLRGVEGTLFSKSLCGGPHFSDCSILGSLFGPSIHGNYIWFFLLCYSVHGWLFRFFFLLRQALELLVSGFQFRVWQFSTSGRFKVAVSIFITSVPLNPKV